MKSLILLIFVSLTLLGSIQASAQYRHGGLAHPGYYPGGYAGRVYPGYGYRGGYGYPGYAYPGYAYPGYVYPGFYGYPSWYNNGVVLPGWAWVPSAVAGLWQCTAVNSTLQSFPQVGVTLELAAEAALTSCGGPNYQAVGC